jgi:hypothetical protein
MKSLLLVAVLILVAVAGLGGFLFFYVRPYVSQMIEFGAFDQSDTVRTPEPFERETLTVEEAKQLVEEYRSRGELYLDSLRELKTDTSTVLAGFNGDLKVGDEYKPATIDSLDPEIAKIFANHRGDLSMNSVGRLSPEAARAFATSTTINHLSFLGLTELSPETAQELAKGYYEYLDLGNWSERQTGIIPELLPGAARPFIDTCKSIALDNVHLISDEAAAIIAETIKADFSLRGLRELSDQAAASLASNVKITAGGTREVNQKLEKYADDPEVSKLREQRRAAAYDAPYGTGPCD